MNEAIKSYYFPSDIREALEIYKSEEARHRCMLAGGTDLKLPVSSEYTVVIDLKGISALRGIELVGGEKLKIGSLATIHELRRSFEIRQGFDILCKAGEAFGSRQVRMNATVGGNICNGSPAADMATALLAHDAALCWQGLDGERRESLEEHYDKEAGARFNQNGYILESIELDMSKTGAASYFYKLVERKATDIGLVCVALVRGKDGNIHVSLGSVAPSPIRARAAEDMINGAEAADGRAIEEAADAAARGCSPITDQHAGAEYRREMARALTKRGLVILRGKEGAI